MVFDGYIIVLQYQISHPVQLFSETTTPLPETTTTEVPEEEEITTLAPTTTTSSPTTSSPSTMSTHVLPTVACPTCDCLCDAPEIQQFEGGIQNTEYLRPPRKQCKEQDSQSVITDLTQYRIWWLYSPSEDLDDQPNEIEGAFNLTSEYIVTSLTSCTAEVSVPIIYILRCHRRKSGTFKILLFARSTIAWWDHGL